MIIIYYQIIKNHYHNNQILKINNQKFRNLNQLSNKIKINSIIKLNILNKYYNLIFINYNKINAIKIIFYNKIKFFKMILII